MLRNGWKSILYLNGLQVAQYAFIVIAAVIGIAVYGLYGVKSGEIFESPVLTVQILLVFSYLFCYLLLKNIRKNMEEDPDAQRAPLWFLLILPAPSLLRILILTIETILIIQKLNQKYKGTDWKEFIIVFQILCHKRSKI